VGAGLKHFCGSLRVKASICSSSTQDANIADVASIAEVGLKESLLDFILLAERTGKMN
jgi:hypothetical protein